VSKTVKIKYDDNVIFEGLSHLSFEAEGTNIQVEHLKDKGFTISVYDKQRKIMHYYDVVDGKLKLSSKENVETGEEMLIRDDIRDRIIEEMQILFPWMDIPHEGDTLAHLKLDSQNMLSFCKILIKEFDLEDITFAKVMQWSTVKDIVDYIEDNLGESDG